MRKTAHIKYSIHCPYCNAFDKAIQEVGVYGCEECGKMFEVVRPEDYPDEYVDPGLDNDLIEFAELTPGSWGWRAKGDLSAETQLQVTERLAEIDQRPEEP